MFQQRAQPPARPRVLNLNDVVTGLRRRLDHTIGAEVFLRTELARDLWPVRADPAQIGQVLVDLAGNTRAAMTGGDILTIGTANVTTAPEFVVTGPAALSGRYVRLRIGGTGAGLPAAAIAHVFEPFPAAESGLGLPAVHGIVAHADATVDVQSQPEAGTTFTILIPVAGEHHRDSFSLLSSAVAAHARPVRRPAGARPPARGVSEPGGRRPRR